MEAPSGNMEWARRPDWQGARNTSLIADPLAECQRAQERPNVAPWRQLADRWALCGHPKGLLLSGDALDQAEHWARHNPQEITEIDREFLDESWQAQEGAKRQSTLSSAINGLLVLVILVALVAIRLWVSARDETQHTAAALATQAQARATAEAGATAQSLQRVQAEATRSAAVNHWLQEAMGARAATSRMLSWSAVVVANHDPELGLLLAMEGVLLSDPLDFTGQALSSLYRLLGHQGWEAFLPNQELELGLYSAWASPPGPVLTDRPGEAPAIWELSTGLCRCHLDLPAGQIANAAWSHDTSRLITRDGAGHLAIWDGQTCQRLVDVGGDLALASATWSADDALVLATDYMGRPSAWEASTGQERQPLDLPCRPGPVAWSPKGTRLVGRSAQGCLAIWHLPSGNREADLANSTGFFVELAWKNDGTEIQGWDQETGEEAYWGTDTGQRLPAHEWGETKWQANTPTLDMGMISLDGGAHLAFGDREQLIAYACQRVGRNLTGDEWTQYVGPDVPYRQTCPEDRG